ncbi:Response regulator receiver protein (fragment) [Syntrophobacter sp. SbD1]
MLHILLVSVRRESIKAFFEGLSSDPGIHLDQVASGTEALTVARAKCPHLIIIDSELPDTESLDLVKKIIGVNAMVNTAVMSALWDHEFHEAAEGLGILCRLPLDPGPGEADGLLKKLRSVLSQEAIFI